MNDLRTKRAHLISNSKSGQGAGGSLPELAQKICQEFGFELVHHAISPDQNLETAANRAIELALKEDSLIIAAGGDGTIRTVAQLAHGRGVRVGIAPCGTFNYFARTHGIPVDHEQALRLALSGETRPVRLGQLNGHVFLINASLGLYVKVMRDREARSSKWGRNRVVMVISTILTLLQPHRLLQVRLKTGDQMQSLRTPMIFVGNNALQLRNLALSVAHCMKKDLLAVVTMKPLTRLETLRVIFRGIFKTIDNESRLERFCVDSLVIETRQKLQTVTLDGEFFLVSSPLNVEALPESLRLVLPPKT